MAGRWSWCPTTRTCSRARVRPNNRLDNRPVKTLCTRPYSASASGRTGLSGRPILSGSGRIRRRNGLSSERDRADRAETRTETAEADRRAAEGRTDAADADRRAERARAEAAEGRAHRAEDRADALRTRLDAAEQAQRAAQAARDAAEAQVAVIAQAAAEHAARSRWHRLREALRRR